MTEAKARLGSLFGANGSGETVNDPLRYSAPKEPTKNNATVAQTGSGGETQNIIYSTTVTLFKYDTGKKSYASCSPSPVGCVILGNNSSYSLLFYNAAKEHLSLSAITVSLRATLQPGQYVNFYDSSGENYSARFNTEVDAQTFIRTLFLTKVHIGIWGGGSIPPNALMKEELSATAASASARAIVEGDTVGVAFSVWRVVGNAGSSPLDVVTKYAPFEKVSATDVRKFRIGDKTERISALEEGVVGMKKGGNRILLAPPGKTNGKDWYILQIELVKVKNDSKEAAKESRRSSEPPKSASNDLAPTSSNDLVIYEKQKEELEKQKQTLLELQKEVDAAKAAAATPTSAQPTMPNSMNMGMYPPPYGANPYGMMPQTPVAPQTTPNAMYPWMMPLGKPLDALVMELHTKVDHLIRIAPASSSSSTLSSLSSLTDASQTLRGVERLVGENERLLQQISLQTQQFNGYETKCDDLQRANSKLQAEKTQWKDQLALQQSDVANLTAARDAAMNQVSRMHQEIQQLRYALYQTQQSTTEQDTRASELAVERDSRARAEAALKNETASRAIAEQELALVKKQVANLTSLHESEIQSQKLTHDRAIAQLVDQHRAELDRLRQQYADEQLQRQQAQPSSAELQKQYDDLSVLCEQWKANAAATTQEVQALQAEKALRLQRISELEQMQAFHANAREQEVQQLQQEVTALSEKIQNSSNGSNDVVDGSCANCTAVEAKLQQTVADVALKEEAAKHALEQADQLKKEAQELLLSSPSGGDANISELFKQAVNDIFYRFQDLLEDEVDLDGNQVLKDIKKVLKQSTKEVLAKVETQETE